MKIKVISSKLNGGEDRFLSRSEAAKLIGVHVNSIDRMANQGIVKKYYAGGLVRFVKSEIENAFKTPVL